MKIVLHGFGTYAIVFSHLVEAARRIAPEIEWAVILRRRIIAMPCTRCCDAETSNVFLRRFSTTSAVTTT